MAGLVPAIDVLLAVSRKKDVDARDKRGHDAREIIRTIATRSSPDVVASNRVDSFRFALCQSI